MRAVFILTTLATSTKTSIGASESIITIESTVIPDNDSHKPIMQQESWSYESQPKGNYVLEESAAQSMGFEAVLTFENDKVWFEYFFANLDASEDKSTVNDGYVTELVYVSSPLLAYEFEDIILPNMETAVRISLLDISPISDVLKQLSRHLADWITSMTPENLRITSPGDAYAPLMEDIVFIPRTRTINLKFLSNEECTFEHQDTNFDLQAKFYSHNSTGKSNNPIFIDMHNYMNSKQIQTTKGTKEFESNAFIGCILLICSMLTLS